MKSAAIELKIMDLPELQALLEQVKAELLEIRRERDEWENAYFELLAEHGGVSSP